MCEDTPLFEYGISTLAVFRWVPPYVGTIIVMPDKALDLSVQSNTGVGRISLVVGDKVDDGPEIMRVEEHAFPKRGPALLLDMCLDNSLEARIAREREGSNMTAEELAEFEREELEIEAREAD